VEMVHLRLASGAIALGLITTGAPALAEVSPDTENSQSAEMTEVAEVSPPYLATDVEEIAQLRVPSMQLEAEVMQEALPPDQAPEEAAIAPQEEPLRVAQSAPLPPPDAPSNEALSQLTSVSQLSDVQPTDWAFQALQSLVERYGVIAGYPDGTFRGNRALTRYEFAAGLNAALDRVNELIAAGLAETVSQEDLATLERLQQEFAVELANLRGRVDNLEARSAELEANQFSTTTRLTGEAIFALNGGTQSEVIDPNVVFFSRVRLNLETSFTGEDRLLTQLQAGSSGENSDAANFLLREQGQFRTDLIEVGEGITSNVLEGLGADLDDFPQLQLGGLETIEQIRDALAANLSALAIVGGSSPEEAADLLNEVAEAVETAQGINGFLQTNSALDYSGSDTDFFLNRLSYTFAASEDLNLSFFAQGFASDYVDFNRYANNSARDFSTYGLINNQLLLANDAPGAGAAFSWNPGAGALTLRGVYKADQAAIATASSIFGGDDDLGGLFNDPNLGVVELAIAPSQDFTVSLQYSTGTQGGNDYDAIGANLELALGRRLGLFGRFGYAFNFPGGIEPASWSAGIAFPDLFIPGALAGIGVGQPLIFQEDVVGLFNGTQTNYEAFYNLPLSDNVAITPVIQVITDPGNRDRDTILTGTLRTVFSF
jgi:hypothetical protein